jgi:2-polyprenyl-6-hydroxyphenyl methylase/3-demethylubiquinone-9 3-methyltransferase
MERKPSKINNAFYDELKDGWHEEHAHPIALLRAENKLRNPWIAGQIAKHFTGKVELLDIGCGGGLLTNHLSQLGHKVHGLDCSQSSLEIAKERDLTQRVMYHQGSALNLPFEAESFDVVCAMDLLEHVEEPEKVIAEAARVLKPGGLFFFHTFSRNFLSYFMIIRGVEWLVARTPPNMHVYKLFINPEEVRAYCHTHQMQVIECLGVRPDFNSKAFWKTFFRRKVDENFSFIFTPSLKTGYSGYAKKTL